MEFRTIKEDGQVQEEIKKITIYFVMQNVSIVKKKLAPSSTQSRKSTTRLPTTALPLLLVNIVKSNEPVMMGSQVELLVYLC